MSIVRLGQRTIRLGLGQQVEPQNPDQPPSQRYQLVRSTGVDQSVSTVLTLRLPIRGQGEPYRSEPLIRLAHPTRFERVTFAVGGQRSHRCPGAFGGNLLPVSTGCARAWPGPFAAASIDSENVFSDAIVHSAFVVRREAIDDRGRPGYVVFLSKTRSIRRLSFHTKAYQPCVLQVPGLIYSLRCTR
jgi:hypothetical protein